MERTNGFVLLSKREQEGFTRAVVEIGRLTNLSDAEIKTVGAFAKRWFEGKDFDTKTTFTWFLNACARHGVKVRWMQKPRTQNGGPMEMVEWSGPAVEGSYWPAYKAGVDPGSHRERKADYRNKIKLEHKAQLGIDAPLVYEIDAIRELIREGIAAGRSSVPAPAPVLSIEPVPVSNVIPIESRPPQRYSVTLHRMSDWLASREAQTRIAA